MNVHLQALVWMYVFISVGYIWRSGIARSHGNSLFNLFFFFLNTGQPGLYFFF